MTSSSMDIPIGTATLEQDGTLTIRLRLDGKMSFGAPTAYPPTHERYAFYKEHLERHDGPMSPGEARMLYPFPSSY
jgi:hypothetical protein